MRTVWAVERDGFPVVTLTQSSIHPLTHSLTHWGTLVAPHRRPHEGVSSILGIVVLLVHEPISL